MRKSLSRTRSRYPTFLMNIILYGDAHDLPQQILQILSMTELNLPTLSLFNKNSFKSRRPHTERPYESPLRDILRETNRIEEQVFAPYLPYRPTIYDKQYHQALEESESVKLHYLNAYNSAYLRAEADSLARTQRIDSAAVSFRRQIPCECEYQPVAMYEKQKTLLKTPYITNKYVPTVAAPAEKQKERKLPSKQVYLDGKKRQQQPKIRPSIQSNIDLNIQTNIQPNMSIIHKIDKSLLQTEKNKNTTNLSKMINDSNVMPTNQSLLIMEPKRKEDPKYKEQHKKQVVQEQVQTDDIGNRSLVRQKMDQANFHKTIRQLNNQINQLSLQLPSEDVVVDLSELVSFKEEYFEQSKEILSSLQALSDERGTSSIRSKRQGDMIWPQF